MKAYLLLVILQEIYVLQVGMEFDLVDGWRYSRCLQDPVEMFWQVVADADSLCESLTLEHFQLLPRLRVVFLLLAKERRMDEIATSLRQLNCLKLVTVSRLQVNIVRLQLLQTRLQGIRNIANVANDFGRKEDLVSRHSRVLDGRAEFRLRFVDFGAILMVVAEPY